MKRSLYLLGILVIFSPLLHAQITAPDADASVTTQYPVFTENDPVYLFCTQDSTDEVAGLSVTTALAGTKTFEWEVYNQQSGSFEFYFQETIDGATSSIGRLSNGCYRATVNQGGNSEVHRAWVFNNWTVATANVSDSDCESFKLNGNFRTASLVYFDLATSTPVTLNKNMQVEWREGSAVLGSLQTMQLFSPPTKNTDYTFRVFDAFGCDGMATVTYESVVTKADFLASPMSGEAPLTVTFTNNSENGTSGFYEWIFYRDIDEIKRESEGSNQPVDSLLITAYDDAPVFTYQNSGTYMVRLVSRHVSDTLVCVDTFTMEDFIKVDTSYVRAANVFTPNGDGVNDEFVIKFWSMKSAEVNIYNRWGKRVHYWGSGDIQGWEDARSESVWDGIISGRKASPGVYYWDFVGRGRDGRKRTENGFVHLFREKD